MIGVGIAWNHGHEVNGNWESGIRKLEIGKGMGLDGMGLDFCDGYQRRRLDSKHRDTMDMGGLFV